MSSPGTASACALRVGCCLSPGLTDAAAAAGAQVGSLLLSFLPVSLQEQISARRYFYKSGRLIKDGIITLSGTDFSRDIMDQVGPRVARLLWLRIITAVCSPAATADRM